MALQFDAFHGVGVARHHHVWTHSHLAEDTDGAVHFYDGSMGRRSPVAVMSGCLLVAGLVAAACGDGVNEGVDRGKGNRGTIDGVTLGTPGTAVGAPGTAAGGGTLVPDTTEPDTVSTEPDTVQPVTTDSVPAPDSSAFHWRALGTELDEGTLDVPLDYSQPNGRTITLSLVRHHAGDPAHRIGTLLVNPGGPGFGGSGLAESAPSIYGQSLVDRFDIIGWDPRGTGLSEPAIDCIENYDDYFAIDDSPTTPAARAALVDAGTRFGAACERANGDLLPFISTENSARDMDRIRAALGEPKISYFGFSYGSELGATWATLFPDTVRAAVLDGAIDPRAGDLELNLQQAAGFEAAFNTFLAQCSADATCAFWNRGKAAAAFDALQAGVERHPVASRAGRPAVNQTLLDLAVIDALYRQSSWPQLERALADLQAGKGRGILQLYDDYYQNNGSNVWDNSLEAYFAYECHDHRGSTSTDELYTHAAEFRKVAPRLGSSWMGDLTLCSVWPVPPDTPVTITGKGAGPILVVGTTGDPATPLLGTRSMARSLEDGHLVVVTADQHTGYGVNRCVDDAVDNYLVDPRVAMPAEVDCH
jgi:pimeloyl-ACP methyl ester carboxylesterase